MKLHILKLSVILLFSFMLISCGKKVTRIDPDSTIDLSGKWNDADSRMVAEEMIKDCLSKPWKEKLQSNKEMPRVIVGRIRNKSHEHINTQTFAKDMERELINSGTVEFVATKSEREDIREEKADQMENASDQTKKELTNESGADVMLYGSVNTIADAEGKKKVMYYQVDLELVEIETNRKLWIGTKKIKKYITRAKATL